MVGRLPPDPHSGCGSTRAQRRAEGHPGPELPRLVLASDPPGRARPRLMKEGIIVPGVWWNLPLGQSEPHEQKPGQSDQNSNDRHDTVHRAPRREMGIAAFPIAAVYRIKGFRAAEMDGGNSPASLGASAGWWHARKTSEERKLHPSAAEPRGTPSYIWPHRPPPFSGCTHSFPATSPCLPHRRDQLRNASP